MIKLSAVVWQAPRLQTIIPGIKRSNSCNMKVTLQDLGCSYKELMHAVMRSTKLIYDQAQRSGLAGSKATDNHSGNQKINLMQHESDLARLGCSNKELMHAVMRSTKLIYDQAQRSGLAGSKATNNHSGNQKINLMQHESDLARLGCSNKELMHAVMRSTTLIYDQAQRSGLAGSKATDNHSGNQKIKLMQHGSDLARLGCSYKELMHAVMRSTKLIYDQAQRSGLAGSKATDNHSGNQKINLMQHESDLARLRCSNKELMHAVMRSTKLIYDQAQRSGLAGSKATDNHSGNQKIKLMQHGSDLARLGCSNKELMHAVMRSTKLIYNQMGGRAQWLHLIKINFMQHESDLRSGLAGSKATDNHSGNQKIKLMQHESDLARLGCSNKELMHAVMRSTKLIYDQAQRSGLAGSKATDNHSGNQKIHLMQHESDLARLGCSYKELMHAVMRSTKLIYDQAQHSGLAGSKATDNHSGNQKIKLMQHESDLARLGCSYKELMHAVMRSTKLIYDQAQRSGLAGSKATDNHSGNQKINLMQHESDLARLGCSNKELMHAVMRSTKLIYDQAQCSGLAGSKATDNHSGNQKINLMQHGSDLARLGCSNKELMHAVMRSTKLIYDQAQRSGLAGSKATDNHSGNQKIHLRQHGSDLARLGCSYKELMHAVMCSTKLIYDQAQRSGLAGSKATDNHSGKKRSKAQHSGLAGSKATDNHSGNQKIKLMQHESDLARLGCSYKELMHAVMRSTKLIYDQAQRSGLAGSKATDNHSGNQKINLMQHESDLARLGCSNKELMHAVMRSTKLIYDQAQCSGLAGSKATDNHSGNQKINLMQHGSDLARLGCSNKELMHAVMRSTKLIYDQAQRSGLAGSKATDNHSGNQKIHLRQHGSDLARLGCSYKELMHAVMCSTKLIYDQAQRSGLAGSKATDNHSGKKRSILCNMKVTLQNLGCSYKELMHAIMHSTKLIYDQAQRSGLAGSKATDNHSGNQKIHLMQHESDLARLGCSNKELMHAVMRSTKLIYDQAQRSGLAGSKATDNHSGNQKINLMQHGSDLARLGCSNKELMHAVMRSTKLIYDQAQRSGLAGSKATDNHSGNQKIHLRQHGSDLARLGCSYKELMHAVMRSTKLIYDQAQCSGLAGSKATDNHSGNQKINLMQHGSDLARLGCSNKELMHAPKATDNHSGNQKIKLMQHESDLARLGCSNKELMHAVMRSTKLIYDQAQRSGLAGSKATDNHSGNQKINLMQHGSDLARLGCSNKELMHAVMRSTKLIYDQAQRSGLAGSKATDNHSGNQKIKLMQHESDLARLGCSNKELMHAVMRSTKLIYDQAQRSGLAGSKATDNHSGNQKIKLMQHGSDLARLGCSNKELMHAVMRSTKLIYDQAQRSGLAGSKATDNHSGNQKIHLMQHESDLARLGCSYKELMHAVMRSTKLIYDQAQRSGLAGSKATDNHSGNQKIKLMQHGTQRSGLAGSKATDNHSGNQKIKLMQHESDLARLGCSNKELMHAVMRSTKLIYDQAQRSGLAGSKATDNHSGNQKIKLMQHESDLARLGCSNKELMHAVMRSTKLIYDQAQCSGLAGSKATDNHSGNQKINLMQHESDLARLGCSNKELMHAVMRSTPLIYNQAQHLGLAGSKATDNHSGNQKIKLMQHGSDLARLGCSYKELMHAVMRSTKLIYDQAQRSGLAGSKATDNHSGNQKIKLMQHESDLARLGCSNKELMHAVMRSTKLIYDQAQHLGLTSPRLQILIPGIKRSNSCNMKVTLQDLAAPTRSSCML
ncbi:hypothetical protein MPSEU_000077200 [Mayamaea pseudoterrestris]|nr:hypothetical protein MPSEU_000077200 [Mayamaea pseudoterrestris]